MAQPPNLLITSNFFTTSTEVIHQQLRKGGPIGIGMIDGPLKLNIQFANADAFYKFFIELSKITQQVGKK